MKALTIFLLLMVSAVLAGCSESSRASQLVELGPLSFEVPAEWTRSDGARPGASTSIWTPEKNDRKQSITIVRTNRPGGASRPPAALQAQLVSAQRSLRDARITRVTPLTTAKGLAGSRIDLSFTPNGVEQRYRRVHVVLVENDATLIHVIYTAVAPDPELDATQLVLDSIAREEAQS